MEQIFQGKQIFDLVCKFRENKKLCFEKEYKKFKHIFNVKEENDTLLFENKNIKKNLVLANIIKENPERALKEMKKSIDNQIILNLIDESIILYNEIHKGHFEFDNKRRLLIKDLI